MKIIAVTQRLVKNEAHEEIRDTLDIKWAQLFGELNFLPVILPTMTNSHFYFNKFDINGIVLTGGNNINLNGSDNLSKIRDEFEEDLIKFAIQKNIPIFGVCRGMQIIGKYFKAKFKKVKNHVATYHEIFPDSNSMVYKTLKKINNVNSFHEYAIDQIGNDFLVSSRSKDGIIESIENKKYKIWGQMWHPEREDLFNKSDLELFKAFFNKN